MIGCLLIHGYLGTPAEVEPLKSPLEAMGLGVHLATLPGHNSSVDEFRQTGFADWQGYVEAEYDRLSAEYDDIIVVGFSLGGALALHLAEERAPRAAVVLAAPVFPRSAMPAQYLDWALLFTPGLRSLRKQTGQRPGGFESQAFAPWQGYKDVVHPPHFYSLYKGFRSVGAKLGQVICPILIIHDERDKVVNVKNAHAIASGVSSQLCELEITHIQENVTVHHILATHCETKTFVQNKVCAFIASVCGLTIPGVAEQEH